MSLTYSTSSVASFEDVKKFGNQPSKDVYIIDVREPSELQETGVIPSSINIPCMYNYFSNYVSSYRMSDVHLTITTATPCLSSNPQ
nr:unnamed protein product [Callosobruchus analis]